MRAVRLTAALLLLASSSAARATTVLWLGEPPQDAQRERLEEDIGPARHLDEAELAWPAAPDAPTASERALSDLGAVLGDCEGRWEAFDVEQDIAWRLGEAADGVELLAAPEDWEPLHRLLLLQGAAAYWAWSPQERSRSKEAKPYLVELGGESLIRPWVDAVALAPDRVPERGDLPDQASYQAFVELRDHLLAQRRGELVVVGLPADHTVVVDGSPAADPSHVQLVPGTHRVHLERDGVPAAPAVVWVAPGERQELTGLVSVDDLDKATERVLDGNLLDVPHGVKDSIELLRGQDDEPFHVAAWTGRNDPEVFELTGDDPWMHGEYERDTALLVDVSLGAGLMGSTAFVESDGATAHGAAATVLQLGGQFAWRRWAVITELAIHDTTGRAGIEYGDVATTTNVVASSFARFTMAPGFYVLRLRPRRTSFVVAAPIGLLSPAHSGVGAQAWFGIPVGRTTWLRLGFDFFKGNELPKWEAIDGVNDPLTTLSLRVGVAQKLH